MTDYVTIRTDNKLYRVPVVYRLGRRSVGVDFHGMYIFLENGEAHITNKFGSASYFLA
ncbi:hypothetical protein BJD66_gp33 [Gordonia phage Emalyn]|uniref:Uncharacterized protein n=1 Tax=Gordonia phage Emalyn TaxID=1821552 RepID=A0A142KBW9_9CAUD|nr:hypothetical protein BJD66_gp33 [Gordonia phage Emalyn]AMS03602.1 hypothetical protein SEA_EMALYN_33 [Gordonia phage Emalyn]UMO76157.1 hypothetical protein SEA_AMOK_34 [Gordonia phage Amok]